MRVRISTAQDFEVRVDPSQVPCAVFVRGELDVDTAPQLLRELREVFDAGVPRLVVDLTKVRFIDSRGMSVLVRARMGDVTRAGQRLRVPDVTRHGSRPWPRTVRSEETITQNTEHRSADRGG